MVKLNKTTNKKEKGKLVKVRKMVTSIVSSTVELLLVGMGLGIGLSIFVGGWVLSTWGLEVRPKRKYGSELKFFETLKAHQAGPTPSTKALEGSYRYKEYVSKDKAFAVPQAGSGHMQVKLREGIGHPQPNPGFGGGGSNSVSGRENLIGQPEANPYFGQPPQPQPKEPKEKEKKVNE